MAECIVPGLVLLVAARLPTTFRLEGALLQVSELGALQLWFGLDLGLWDSRQPRGS